ncbi:MAG: NAD kinase [Corynebacterium sp.]|nr:NAD kinase [Corynebacterium sp.]
MEILLVPHVGRASNLEAAIVAASMLEGAGIQVRVDTDHELFSRFPQGVGNAELVIALGGDGTFLRAADMARPNDLPVLGINLGHVGFLAEWESDSLEEAIRRVIAGDYHVEDRTTLDIRLGEETSWALNEASVVNNDNTRGVLDAELAIDDRPVSGFGCDGIIVSTPTGSTAYAFSAGGPVLWPELEALLVVPNNAHALFARPLVIGPDSKVEIRVHTPARVALDGYRSLDMPAGSTVVVTKGSQPVRWVRLDNCPFTSRLVRKFRLPTSGWRQP